MPRFLDRTGQRYGRLIALRAVRRAGGVYWECECDCGTLKVVRGASLGKFTRSCGCLFMEHAYELGAMGRKDEITYSGAHNRIRRERGPAKNLPCVDCGKRAYDWSYEGTDRNEMFERRVLPHGGVVEAAFSADPSHYTPRCRPCHAAFDKRAAARRLSGSPRPEGPVGLPWSTAEGGDPRHTLPD